MSPIPADRLKHEADLANGLSKLFGMQYKQVTRLMGDPPDFNKIPDSFWKDSNITMTAALSKEMEKEYVYWTTDKIIDMPIPVNWSLINERAARWAKDHAGELITKIDETTRQWVRDKISDFYTKEWTRGELENVLFKQFGPVRAEMIAITEVTSASARAEDGIWDMLAEQGIEMDTEWQTSYDELVCTTCEPMNGKLAIGRDSSGPYWEDGLRIPAHPRCRCNEGNVLPAGTRKELEDRQKGTADFIDDLPGMTRHIIDNSTDFGMIREHGMRNIEKARAFKYGDQNFIFTADGAQGLSQDIRYFEQLKQNGTRFPKGLMDNTKSIYYTGQANVNDAYWATQYNMPGFQSLATGGDGNIVVYNGNNLGGGFFHEAGHNLSVDYYGYASPPSGTKWADLWEKGLAGGEAPVSQYGTASIAEDFAEACEMFVRDPRYMAKNFPDRYKLVKEILDKYE